MKSYKNVYNKMDNMLLFSDTSLTKRVKGLIMIEMNTATITAMLYTY